MGRRVFIIVVLAAFAVCAVALAQQRKAIDEARFGSVEVMRTESHVMRPARTLVIPWHVNYQGYLTDDAGTPINDTLSMTFGIWDAASVGTELWNENQNVVVEEGLFNVILGSVTPIPSDVFGTGESRWLELTVGIQPLFPRTEITSVAYAYRSVKTDSAEYALDTDMVDGFDASVAPTANDLFPLSYGDAQYVNEGQVDAIDSPMILDGTILRADVDAAFKAPYADTADYALDANVAYVDSAGVSANSWRLEANTLTDLDSRWVNEGQADAITSSMIVDGTILRGDADAAFKAPYSDTADYAFAAPATPDNDWTITGNVLHPSAAYGLAMRGSNVLYGVCDTSHVNLGIACTTGTSGQDHLYCTVGGGYGNTAGGWSATVGGGYQNTANSWFATVGGGSANTASGQYAAVGGGLYNFASSAYATVGGGSANTASGQYAAVGGGRSNTASGLYATVGGGESDTANARYGGVLSGYSNLSGDQPEDTAAVVAGGWNNSATGRYSFVGGGSANTASGNYYATVGGGYYNTASGSYATVSGGQQNTASNYDAAVGGGRNNTASGGYATVSGGQQNTASGGYATVGGGYADTVAASYSFAAGRLVRIASGAAYTFAFGRDFTTSTANAVIFHNSVSPIRVGIGVTGPTNFIDVAGGAYCNGTNWVNASSREYKKEISPLCPEEYQEILEKLAETEVVRFRYKEQEDDELHIGVIAEDAPEEIVDAERKGVPTGDAIGFLLAALKAQQDRIEALEAKIEGMEEKR